jgi:magnesium transporter
MPTADDPILDRIEAALESADPAARMATATQGVRPEDLAAALLRLDTSATIRALSSLDAERAAYTLIELPTERARAVINQLPDATVAHYLDILPMDDAVELREELDPRRFEALLRVIPDEDAQEIRRLLAYPEGSAGQIMTEDFVEVGPDATMNDVLAVIRETSPEDYETVNYIYVLDDARRLLGLLTLRRVIRAQPLATAREVMNPEPVTARVTDREEDLARTLAKYGFSAIPVLDDAGVMVGIVTADDAQEILEEAETEDVLALGAVTGDAEPYLSLGVVELMKRRVPWLVILFLAEFFTGTVLRHYVGAQAEASTDEALGTLAKLQLFIPLLIGAGGNAGSQVTTTITRA